MDIIRTAAEPRYIERAIAAAQAGLEAARSEGGNRAGLAQALLRWVLKGYGRTSSAIAESD